MQANKKSYWPIKLTFRHYDLWRHWVTFKLILSRGKKRKAIHLRGEIPLPLYLIPLPSLSIPSPLACFPSFPFLISPSRPQVSSKIKSCLECDLEIYFHPHKREKNNLSNRRNATTSYSLPSLLSAPFPPACFPSFPALISPSLPQG